MLSCAEKLGSEVFAYIEKLCKEGITKPEIPEGKVAPSHETYKSQVDQHKIWFTQLAPDQHFYPLSSWSGTRTRERRC